MKRATQTNSEALLLICIPGVSSGKYRWDGRGRKISIIDALLKTVLARESTEECRGTIIT